MVAAVTVVNWNPRRPLLGGRLRSPRRINNFGDLLGPLVVGLMRRRLGLAAPQAPARLLTVGSIMHLARSGDVVWGSGVNGKVPAERHTFEQLDVRGVRGPLTADVLSERGITVPRVYGDPALLLPLLMPELRAWAREKKHGTLLVPNLNDHEEMRRSHGSVLNPQLPLRSCLRAIAQSEAVVGSSLHAIIIAESLGVPARLVASGSETFFKYEDYYRGTGREPITPAADAIEGLATVPGTASPLEWDPAPLLEAFPADLWSRSGPARL